VADVTQVGREYRIEPFEVERTKMRELAQAIGDPNPIYATKDAALKEGYRDMPGPPTFPAVVMNWSRTEGDLLGDVKVNYAKILHGGEEYEYHREIHPGDILSGRTKVTRIEPKAGKSGTMYFITLETVFNDQNGEKVVTIRTTMIERA